ncbi:MAG: YkgJ family cysteine cluster protein [Deltaproteobacteria bacterium]|nr:YkgJ family cysteine cluster protein [Deltaproteobacteria bacterium]MBN2671368.1 YkgJ family cysteine cluster protein [Deltaproteobacteria bacterium]
MLQAYLQLRDRTDRFFESVASRYSDQIVCKPGCAKCCEGGLTVVIVEAVALGIGLGLSKEHVHIQAGQEPLSNSGKCAFLDERGHCLAYAYRPLVCRTHGMPLLLPDAEEVSVCDLNFAGIAPHSSAVLNTENLNAALFAANLVYCQKEGLDSRSRIALDRLAELSGLWVRK